MTARLAAMLEPMSHLAWDTLGAGEFPYAEGVARWDERAFVAAMEAEDEPVALAHVRGAIAERIPYARLRPAFGESALSHYADFGHSAIYTLKAGQLIERLGEDAKRAGPAGAGAPADPCDARGAAARIPRLRESAGRVGRQGPGTGGRTDFIGLSIDGA